MHNTIELVALAERAGLEVIVSRSPAPGSIPSSFLNRLTGRREESFSVCVAALSGDHEARFRPFNFRSDPSAPTIEGNIRLLRAASERLSPGGLMFIYGLPQHLPRYATALSGELAFRYWIAARAATATAPGGLRPEHSGLLLLSRPGAAINRIRTPHARCRCCGETLKDWGGKSHLMHPRGALLSDVWMDLVVSPADDMPPEIFERILELASDGRRGSMLLLAPERERPSGGFTLPEAPKISASNPLDWLKPSRPRERRVPDELVDRLHKGACLEILRAVPSETVDLAFADPPFNLTKNYSGYSDDRDESDYIGWCKRWLVEYERVLKPGGALFLLNLPKWSVHLADFLTRTGSLYLRNWIVWNALPEPKGLLMPAHYSLLYLTKGPRANRFNYCSMENGWEPFDEAVFPPDRADVCGRRKCQRARRASTETWRGELTDIWHDIHRDRRPADRNPERKAHPCATPERLVDRIVRLATNPGDLVLDAFAGTGTSAFISKRLGRRFIAIEQDDGYHRHAEHRMIRRRGAYPVPRRATRRSGVSKRALQIELQELALNLGRLPTRADVERLSQYSVEMFETGFESWNTALKAARLVTDIVAGDPSLHHAASLGLPKQLELFDRPLRLGHEPGISDRGPGEDDMERVSNEAPETARTGRLLR
ncbi:MAG TPA: DNA methyltransferase [Blastocatellia bacterium]|jgi:site-specific DNA-methyltransferase (adenine-specific)|nr:DNA methyltransferase [Blastocatellia bacterium]